MHLKGHWSDLLTEEHEHGKTYTRMNIHAEEHTHEGATAYLLDRPGPVAD